MSNKKGVSAVVATILIVLLSVTAVVIVWQVIKPALEKTAGKVSFNCIEVELKINSLNCANRTGTVGVSLNKGKISKLKFVFYNATDSKVKEKTDVPEELGMKTYSFVENETVTNMIGVNVAPVIASETGEEQVCSFAQANPRLC